jgi:hypothetical protein
MRCCISRIQGGSVRCTFGACLAFAACVLTAAAATGQYGDLYLSSKPEQAATPAKDKAATPATKTAVAPAAKKNTKTAVPSHKKAVGARAESVSIATPAKSASAEQSIARALRVKADFHFQDAPLGNVVESLKKLTKLDIQFDTRVLEDVNVTTETPVTFSAKDMSVQNALKFMLRSMNPELTWVTQDNVLLITTPDVAGDTLETRVYAVQDLIAPRPSYPFQGMYVPGVSAGGFPRTLPAGSTGVGAMGMGGGMMSGMGGMGGTGTSSGGMGGMGGMGSGGGGMWSVPDKPQRDNTSRATGVFLMRPQILAQMAPPPKQAGGKGGSTQAGGDKRDAGLNFTMDDLINTITSCIKSTSWDNAGGPGSISPMGGMLVVNQSEAIHQQIEKFLDNLRASSPGLKTVTVRATWLLLDLKQLNQLSSGKSGNGGIDHNALDEMAAKAKGYIGAITCLSGQTVHIASGRSHSAVVGAVPVVGLDSSPDQGKIWETSQQSPFWKRVTTNPEFTLVNLDGGLDTLDLAGRGVGYQPITSNPQSGAMLQITPHLLPNTNTVLLDLCTSVTHAEISPEPIHFLGSEKGDAKKDANGLRPAGSRTSMNLDRVNVVVGQLATTLKVPLGQPTLVGGLTREPAADEQEAADTPQLYLFIEATVK